MLLVLFSKSTKQEEGISFGAQQKNLRSLSRLGSECSCPRGKRRQARCLDDGCTVGILPKKEKNTTTTTESNNNKHIVWLLDSQHCAPPCFFIKKVFFHSIGKGGRKSVMFSESNHLCLLQRNFLKNLSALLD